MARVPYPEPPCCSARVIYYKRGDEGTRSHREALPHRPSGLCPVAVCGGRCRLLDRDRVGRRKGILESFVERVFLVPALALEAGATVLTRFVFRLRNHFDAPKQRLPRAETHVYALRYFTIKKQRDQFVVATTARLISRRNVDAVVAYLCHLYAPHYKRSGVFDTSLTCHLFLMLQVFVRCATHPSIVGTQG
jgi:hypothetical protein